MDAFEFNKIAGAALTALLVVFGGKTIVQLLEQSRAPHKEAAYTLPKPKSGEAGGGTDAAKFNPTEVLALLPKASAENGQEVFKKCTACHTPDKGGANKVGPNLYGLVEREIGKHPGFAYSPAMASQGGRWSYEHLANYLHDPKGYIPNNKMAFVGISDNAELADLLAYLRTLSDSPVPLPE
jgi:cytochrome c